MSLTKEWINRINHWDHALWQICYEPLATFELSGFVTKRQLTPEQALRRSVPHGVLSGSMAGSRENLPCLKRLPVDAS